MVMSISSDSISGTSSLKRLHPSRRRFLKSSVAATGGLVTPGLLPLLANDITKAKNQPETIVKTFYDSLTPEQRKIICFPYDHDLRLKIENNWHITKAKVESFSKDQQAMIKDIFMGIHSDEYAEKVFEQVEWDSGIDGFEGGSSVAIFGTPGSGRFEFVLTGRHCTRRCDGDSMKGAAFGGPIFYGHAARGFNESPKHEDNAYWYQAVRANEVYQMLDGKQRKAALLGKSRGERGKKTVELSGKKTGLDGIRVGDLAADQRGHVMKVVGDLLAPFREEDAQEAMKHIKAGGIENLHLSFYRDENLGDDEVWDVWQLEGPSMVSYFRGLPHVHAWLHIREPS